MIKSKIKESNKEGLDFPKLMVSELGAIVLFPRAKKGAVVGFADNSSSKLDIGDFSNDWDMSVFKDFYGTVELSND